MTGARMPVRAIIAFAAQEFGISEEAIMGRARFRPIVLVRHAVCAAACGVGWSTPHVGRVLGGRDHSTIIHGRDKADVWAAYDADYAEKLARVRAFAQQPRKAWVPVVVAPPKPKPAPDQQVPARKVRERNDFGDEVWGADSLQSGSVALLKALRREFPARCAA